MFSFRFTLVIDYIDHPPDYWMSCFPDATVSLSGNHIHLHFWRWDDSIRSAVYSAINDVEYHGGRIYWIE